MVKNIASWVAVGFLSLFLVLALIVLPVSMELTNRQTMKSWLGNTRMLEGAVKSLPDFLAQVQTDEEQSNDDITALLKQGEVDSSQLVIASEKILTPEYLRQKTDAFVDGVYDWLEGKTKSPEFNIVISDRLTALADSISKPLTSELEKLPTCPPSTEYSAEFNPIVAKCVPPGLDINELVNDYSDELVHFGDTPDLSFSSADLDLDDSLLTAGPRVYSFVNHLPLYLGGLILVFSVLVVLLGKSIKYGLRKLSWIYIVNGALTGIGFWLLGHTDIFLKTSDIDAPQLVIDNIINPITKVILTEISKTGVMLSLISIGLGLTIWLSSLLHHKVTHSHDSYSKVHDSTPDEKTETKYIDKISR